jgi:hypothetical protein
VVLLAALDISAHPTQQRRANLFVTGNVTAKEPYRYDWSGLNDLQVRVMGMLTFVVGTRPADDNWRCFLRPAEEWLVAYFCLPVHLTSVQPFAIAHSVELYLKAAYAQRTGSVQKAIQMGHRVKVIWDELKQDPAFMPDHEIVESIYNQPAASSISGALPGSTSPEESRMYFDHQELYLVMHLVVDLKYLGAPMKAAKGAAISVGWTFSNDYWIRFIRSLRAYLHYPGASEIDFVAEALADTDIPARARFYLTQIYSGVSGR